MATFSELVRQKEHMLVRLSAVSVRQLEIVRSGDVTRLIQLLGQKQQLMYDLEEIERQLAPHKDLAPEQRKWTSEQERTETVESINRWAVLLQEIIQNDTASTEEVAAQKNEVESQLRLTRQATRVQNGYAKQAPPDDFRHFDRES